MLYFSWVSATATLCHVFGAVAKVSWSDVHADKVSMSALADWKWFWKLAMVVMGSIMGNQPLLPSATSISLGFKSPGGGFSCVMKYERDKSIFPMCSTLLCKKGVKTNSRPAPYLCPKSRSWYPLQVFCWRFWRSHDQPEVMSSRKCCHLWVHREDNLRWEVSGSCQQSPPTSCWRSCQAGDVKQKDIPVPRTHWESEKKVSVWKKVSQILITSFCVMDPDDNSLPDESGTVGNQISVLIKSFIKADQLITCCHMTSLLYISS